MAIGEFKMKISLLGDGAVGKTCLIKKYVFDTFSDDYLLTLGTKTTRKNLAMPIKEGGNVNLTFMIWDIMGQKEFERLHSMFFQGSKGAIVVCDCTRKETLKSLENWVTNLYKVAPNVPLVFAINKYDLIDDEGEYTLEEVEAVASNYDTVVMPTSAKTGLNVEKAFYELGRRLLVKHHPTIKTYPEDKAPAAKPKPKPAAEPEKKPIPEKEAPPVVEFEEEGEEEPDEATVATATGGKEKFSDKLKRLMLERRKKVKELEELETQIHKLLVAGAKKLQQRNK
jgi:small GTP-binding protein